MLQEKIKKRDGGIILYGITPPRKSTSYEKILEISKAHIQRINSLNASGLVVYDIQDETSRTTEERPFPYKELLEPYEFSESHLGMIPKPKIIYSAVGKYKPDQFDTLLARLDKSKYLSVFVGAASKQQDVSLGLKQAYEIRKKNHSDLVVGGVVIPERHAIHQDEHLRVFRKIENGCSFFISQGVYDVKASKDFLSDYYYHGKSHGIPLVPIIFTLTACGSLKTLEFMKWLGIDFPRYLENDLIHSQDILARSVEILKGIWRELKEYATQKEIPIGCNIESVSIRKEEIEASVDLLKSISLEK